MYCHPCVSELPLTNKSSKVMMSIDRCFDYCLEFFGTNRDYVLMKNRKRERVLIRQMCMYACKLYTIETLERIGYFFGGKDHTTVIHSVNTINNLCDTDEDIKWQFDQLKLHLEFKRG